MQRAPAAHLPMRPLTLTVCKAGGENFLAQRQVLVLRARALESLCQSTVNSGSGKCVPPTTSVLPSVHLMCALCLPEVGAKVRHEQGLAVSHKGRGSLLSLHFS